MQSTEPQGQPEGQYAPQPDPPIIFDTFLGINTNASRPGIADTEMYWCDGFFPLGKNNLRTLPDVGTAIYSAAVSGSIVWYDFANIGTSPLAIVLLSNGSLVQVNTITAAVTSIAGPGTILNPSQTGIGITQWGNQFIVIVANQTNGYFAWDGSVFYQGGTIAPLVNVTNSGLNYSTQPNIIVETTGSGTPPTFNATLNNDVIEQVNVLTPGSGFGINDFVNLVIQGGGSDNTARATATIGPGGGVMTVDVLQSGSGYTIGDPVHFSGGGGSGATALANIVGTGPQGMGGRVQSVTVLQPGSGYTSSPTATVQNGTGAVLAVNIFEGVITAINVTDGGSGYLTPPTVSLIGDGTGGTFLAQINSAGQVTGVFVINGGQGYTKALVHFSGGNNAAEATVDLMPFGIQGSDAETYQSRVWAANGNKISFTAADSLSDFATSDGGGTIEATDSFLRNSYTSLKQTNGFLYIIADSSENYISGVTTTGTPPSTTFNNQNADPEIGTSWPSAVDVFSRNIIFANSFGVHISYGGAVTKISEPLDGVYASVPGFGGFIPSAGKAIIFGKKVWVLLLPVVDFITGQKTNKLFLWNGKTWFSSQQGVSLRFIGAQELNSVLTTYGTDGSHIYPLFQTPSTNFTKTVQSKLWDRPGGYMFTKTQSRIWGLFNYYSILGGTTTITVDNENGQSASSLTFPGPQVVWVTVLGGTASWTTVGGTAVTWITVIGVVVMPPTEVAQNGSLVGLTLSTTAADMAVISIGVDSEVYSYRG